MDLKAIVGNCLGVEEVGAFEVLVALLVGGVDAVGLDRKGERAGGRSASILNEPETSNTMS